MFTILIPDRLKPPADIEQRVFGEDAKIVVAQATQSDQIPDEVLGSCDAVLAWHDLTFDKAFLGKLHRCKVIVRVGVGFDNIGLSASAQFGIRVCTVPDYGVHDVADHTMGLLLSLSRGIIPSNDYARCGGWDWDFASGLRRITNTTLGIIGLGRIGGAVAHRARAFGMKILFYDPYQPVGIEKAWNIERCGCLEAIAEQSDTISVHTPLTEETRLMIGGGFFRRCGRRPLFINTARGGIVDLDALYLALVDGTVRGAGLDVLIEEPPNSEALLVKAWKESGNELNRRLIITPHCAFCNRESIEEMRRKASKEALRVLRGEAPESCVNEKYFEKMI